MALLLPLVGACGGKAPEPKAASSDYDWSDYKGTFANGGPAASTQAVTSKATAPSDDAKAKEAASKDSPPAKGSEAKDATTANLLKDATDAKKSRGTIQGESVSSVSADTVAAAFKKKMKKKVVSSNLLVGQEYEQLNVVVKGVALQIVRPAATPDPSGPKIRSPKARNDGLAKAESAWFDEDANVLVLVQAGKKASSQKVLTQLLKK